MNCIACHTSTKPKLKYKIPAGTKLKAPEFNLFECPRCGLGIWSPLIIVENFYKYELPSTDLSSLGSRPLTPYMEKFFQFNNLNEHHSILDVGCGDGAFLQHCKKYTPNVSGLDFDEKCIAACKTRGISDVQLASVENYYLQNKNLSNNFDFISFFEVLEHQDKHKQFINTIRSLLSDNGKIIGSVPNSNRPLVWLERALVNKKFHFETGDYPPPHLTRWTEESLRCFFSNNGFEVMRIEPVGFGGFTKTMSWTRYVLLVPIWKLLGGSNPMEISIKKTEQNSSTNSFDLKSLVKFVLFTSLWNIIFGIFHIFYQKKGYQIYFEVKKAKMPR